MAYLCEYHPPFAHSEKYYDRDEFFMLTGLLIFASAFTLNKNDGKAASVQKSPPENDPQVNIVKPTSAANDVLNRDQTEEWKGWMQFMFLLYHYYHAEEVYNSIRIMITCYVWMTGFGNFSFFYLKADYSLVRVLQMLWRLNFLVIFLCLTQGTTYILYYICPLHTYFFLMVYVVMRLFKNLNYTKYGLRLKLAVLAVFIYLLWDIKSLRLFEHLHFYLPETPQLGAGSGALWEWYFRTSLDHWSTFLGMVYAANYPITSLFIRKLEAQPFRQEWMAKGAIGVCLFAVFFWWVTGPFRQEKLEYNATNAYYGFIPLITYAYFRNISPTLRSYSLDLLHQIGKSTLETYLMQHHIWLTSNAKSLLTIIPGWPKMNFLVVTIVYFFTARRLYKITLFLRGMFLPDDKTKCIQSYVGISVVIGGCYCLAFLLESMRLNYLSVVSICCVLGGIILYNGIMTLTWRRHAEEQNILNCNSASDIVSLCKSGPASAGILALYSVGLLWHVMAVYGAGKISALPESCAGSVNNGMWVPVTTCNELQNGVGYYEYDVGSYGTCGGMNWGWQKQKSKYLCRFSMRQGKALKQAVQKRRITFVGDSTTRNLYFSFCRSLGDESAGAYDASVEKHVDITKTLAGSTLEFKWAPFATDEVDVLAEVKADTPDLVVVGGGAWDLLHNWSTPEDKTAHRDAVFNLKQKMDEYLIQGIPTVWVVPTTLNDPALPIEKKEYMTEGQMNELRAVYAELGVLESSSFVLNGPSFTKQRVAESHDGVHYPFQVYDAGVQILANSLDWLLAPIKLPTKEGPRPGKMAQPLLGLMMIGLSLIGLFLFDSYFGASYIATIFVPGVAPRDMYEEAFSVLHEKMKLPPIQKSTAAPSNGGRNVSASKNEDEELDKLIKDVDDIEMSSSEKNCNE